MEIPLTARYSVQCMDSRDCPIANTARLPEPLSISEIPEQAVGVYTQSPVSILLHGVVEDVPVHPD